MIGIELPKGWTLSSFGETSYLFDPNASIIAVFIYTTADKGGHVTARFSARAAGSPDYRPYHKYPNLKEAVAGMLARYRLGLANEQEKE